MPCRLIGDQESTVWKLPAETHREDGDGALCGAVGQGGVGTCGVRREVKVFTAWPRTETTVGDRIQQVRVPLDGTANP